MFGQNLPFKNRDTKITQRGIANMFDSVDGQPFIGTGMRCHDIDDLLGKTPGRRGRLIACFKIEKTSTAPQFANQWQMR